MIKIGVQKKLMVIRNKRSDKIGVQKKLMVIRNKISDKNWCAEEVDGNEEQKKR